MSIVGEAPGFLQVFSDGSVKRFAPEISASSLEFCNGCRSKDVIINPSKPISARIFSPDTSGSADRLPVLVYFHGGGFCIGSTTWSGYHHFLGDLSVASQSIVVSVDYRLAPEYRLPIAYEDCYGSLEWLSHHANSDPWLDRADLSRVFLSGDSAGGNIAHHVALKVMLNRAHYRVKIMGLLLIHPYFGSERRTEQEMADGESGDLKMNDMFWKLSLPKGSSRDHFACNFETEMSMVEWDQFPAAAVYVAGLDFLKERGLMYAEFLKKKGVKEVITVEAEGESHVFHVFHPESEATRLLQHQMSEFMNRL